MRTPLRRSIAQVLKIARAGGRSLRQRIWSDAYRFPRGSAQTLAQPRPRSHGAGDTFLTVPYRPILVRLDCHAAAGPHMGLTGAGFASAWLAQAGQCPEGG